MAYIGNQPGTGVRSRFIYTATASQTTFTGADNNSKTLKYADSAYVDVFLNGVCLVPGTDYTASTKTSIVLTQAASLNDTLEVVAYDIATISDTVSKADGGTFEANVTFAAAADIITETLGTDNVRLGEGAGDSIASGGNLNVTIGKDAGTAITTGTDNTFVGSNAGDALIDSDHNVAIGHQALTADTKGSKSTAVGAFSLNVQNHSSATDSHNTAVGYAAGGAITTGVQSTLVGSLCGDALTTGSLTAVGYLAGSAANTSIGNVLMGELAGTAITDGNNNTAVGSQALSSITSSTDNTAIGHDALRYLTSGSENTCIGSEAGDNLTVGRQNVAVGNQALSGDGNGGRSTAVGATALKVADASGGSDNLSYNVAVGYGAGVAVTTGYYNTYIGGLAAQNNTTGVNNIIIGMSAETPAVDTAQVIGIGASITTQAANNFTFGFGATDSNIAFGATSITAPSDERYKEEIASSTAGLSFINDLRPVTLKWKKEKDIPSDHKAYVADSEDRVMQSQGETRHGFIAQEVKTAIDNHSEIKDGFDMWSADPMDGRQRIGPSALIPILTKAIQDLSAKNDALEARLDALEAE